MYAAPHAWRIYEFPWRAALRLQLETDYVRARMADYELGLALETNVPGGGVVFSQMSVQRSWQSRRVAVGYQSGFARRVRDIIWTPAFEHLNPGFRHVCRATAPHVIQTLRIEQTAAASHTGEVWSISEIQFSSRGAPVELPGGSTAHSSRNRWFAANAVDGNPATRWTAGRAMRSGEWIEVRLPRPVELDEVTILCTQDQWSSRMKVTAIGPGSVRHALTQSTMEVAPPLPDLRPFAAQALRAEGVGWLLIHNDDHGAADLKLHTSEWGLDPIALNPDVTLYRVNPTDPPSP
jgi:hypothetical protein